MAERKRQLTRDDWTEAARKALIAGGVDEVKVDRLAKKLKMTRGSFYWHFKHRKDLLDAVLKRWEQQNLDEIEQARARSGTGDQRLLEVARIWLSEDPAYPTFNMAVRFWARKSRPVAALVRRIDDAWIGIIQAMFEDVGIGPPESFVRARIIYFHQIGYYALAIEDEFEDRLQLLPLYHKVLVGKDMTPALDALVEDLRARSSPRRSSG